MYSAVAGESLLSCCGEVASAFVSYCLVSSQRSPVTGSSLHIWESGYVSHFSDAHGLELSIVSAPRLAKLHRKGAALLWILDEFTHCRLQVSASLPLRSSSVIMLLTQE